jgi:membrane associated rhomboid family serine protease
MIGASAAVTGAMAAAIRFVFQRGGPAGLLRSRDDAAYHVAAVPLRALFRDPRLLVFLLVWFGLNALFGLPFFSLAGEGGNVAWEAHMGGFLTGLLAFSLFDPVGGRAADAAEDHAPTTEPPPDDGPV